METSHNSEIWCSVTTYQKDNSSIVSKGAMNRLPWKMFPLARMFPLAVMRTLYTTQNQYHKVRQSSNIFTWQCSQYLKMQIANNGYITFYAKLRIFNVKKSFRSHNKNIEASGTYVQMCRTSLRERFLLSEAI